MQTAQLTKSSRETAVRPAAPLPSLTFPALLAVVSLPAAKIRSLINAHMNSHHNRLVLKVAEVLFSFLCAPRCSFCAVFAPPQCTAHRSLYRTVRSRKSHVQQRHQRLLGNLRFIPFVLFTWPLGARKHNLNTHKSSLCLVQTHFSAIYISAFQCNLDKT